MQIIFMLLESAFHQLFCVKYSFKLVTFSKNYARKHKWMFFFLNTVHMYTWHWDDMPLNSPKRPPQWNSTSGFDFKHITAVDMSFCTSLRNFIQIGPPSAEKNDVMSIFKMANLSHLGF